jgi:eukaryotic translation initiation factor 2C
MLIPESILLYRDEVSDTQYGMVLREGLPQIKAGWNDAYREIQHVSASQQNPRLKVKGGVKLKVNLIVVTKRHHTRFYKDDDTDENIAFGSCIDPKIVAPNRIEFYLQSHLSALGTGRSSYHTILANESGYTLDKLKSIVSIPQFIQHIC